MSLKPLEYYMPWMDAILKTAVKEHTLIADPPLSDILRNPRLIIVFNHSSPISWLPAVAVLAHYMNAAGAKDRVTRGIIDNWFYKNPLTLPLAEFVSQSREPLTFDQILTEFKNTDSQPWDLAVFPEGAHTFFGTSEEIKTFRSPKFIELAVRAGVPILLAVHKGSESWSTPLPIPAGLGALLMPFSKFFGESLDKEKTINLPIPMSKIEMMKMGLKLYVPPLYEADLSADQTERKNQLQDEAENIRSLMEEMFQAL